MAVTVVCTEGFAVKLVGVSAAHQYAAMLRISEKAHFLAYSRRRAVEALATITRLSAENMSASPKRNNNVLMADTHTSYCSDGKHHCISAAVACRCPSTAAWQPLLRPLTSRTSTSWPCSATTEHYTTQSSWSASVAPPTAPRRPCRKFRRL